MTKVIWFRRDLRLDDNPALSYAVEQGDILPIYILDDDNAKDHKMGSASRVWLHHSLESLNNSLNGKLRLFKGPAEGVLKKLHDQIQFDGLYWNRCYEPWQISRDKNIKDNFLKLGVDVKSFKGSLLWEPWTLLKDDGNPYKIFTPFYKRASHFGMYNDIPLNPPQKIDYKQLSVQSLNLNGLNLLSNKPWEQEILKGWNIGEQAAHNRLNTFLEEGINHYKDGRNYPSQPYVSKLSPHIHFGEISVRRLWHSAKIKTDGLGLDTFLSELGWREFSYYLLYHFPELPTHNLQKKFDAFPWNDNQDYLKKWQTGQTGYPIVDAGMRQLWQTGYMHNRLRMIVGSFLIKNLRLHWHHGAAWFWDCLLDADLASNSASWQWVAGCGTDASPYFRIFNPVTQGEKFDADGTFTKQFVPELKNLPTKYLFKPWEASDPILQQANVILGKTYPYPVVDLKTSRNKALEAYSTL